MLDRLGMGGGAAGAERGGITGVPEVELVVAACADGTTFGLGGMYGVSFSPPSAVFGTGGAGLVESATFSRRATATGTAASGRGAGTGAAGLAELPT